MSQYYNFATVIQKKKKSTSKRLSDKADPLGKKLLEHVSVISKFSCKIIFISQYSLQIFVPLKHNGRLILERKIPWDQNLSIN